MRKRIAIDPDVLKASILRDSFFDFVREFWNTVIPEEPVFNWHIRYLCEELQTVAERVFRKEEKRYDLIINISPGSTKSTICSVMFPAWTWTRLPSAKLICGSYAHMLALDLSRKTRMVIQSDLYKGIFPEVVLTADQNTKGFFVNSEGGGRISVGSGGSITGFHGHFIIVDDPIDPNGSFSDADLVSVNNWMRETLPTRKVDKAVTPTILIMQRLHQNDPTGEWLERSGGKGVKHICLPADDSEVISPPELTEKYIDGLMDPVRLSRSILEEHRESLGEYAYTGQFLQRPMPRGGGDFLVNLIQIENPPNTFHSAVRYWDKAGTKDGGAYTAGVLMAKDKQGVFWILDVVRGQWEAAERERIIRRVAEMDGGDVKIGIEQEPGSGGKESAQTTARNLSGFRVTLDRPVGDKATRAYPFAAQVNSGNVRMEYGDWNRKYLDELSYFPRSKYKDQVDASSGAFAMLAARRRIGGVPL